MILGVANLALVYLLIWVSGARLVSRLPLVGRMERWVMAGAFATAQLVLSMQVLSLVHQLTGPALIGLNAALAGLMFAVTRRSGPIPSSGESPSLIRECAALARANPLVGIALALAAASVVGTAVVGGMVYPLTDLYHYGMPLFWKQHASILPFPTFDPRLIGVVFGSEALCFPGFLFLNTGTPYAWASGAAGLMLIWITVATARQLGASAAAAGLAGALAAGIGPISKSLLGAMADILLAAMWFAASIYFLLASRGWGVDGTGATGSRSKVAFGCSVFCLILGASTKNTVILQAPAWLAVAVWWHGGRLFRSASIWNAVRWGLPAVVASGLAWSYVSNLVWFGTIKGGRELQGTVSTEMHPRSIWTRIVRGVVVIATDVIWVPARFSETYARASVQAVRVLGGRERLDEDTGFFSFTEDGPRPGRGLGPLGALFFLPAVVAGLVRIRRLRGAGPELDHSVRGVVGVAVVTAGSFLVYYVVLRWQSIGLDRLMVSCFMAGLPLVALLLERTWVRVAAMIVLLGCLGVYGVHTLGTAVRRLDLAGRSTVASAIARLQRDHSLQVEYRWTDGRTGPLEIREDYTRFELYQLFFSRVQRPAVIGIAGSFILEGYFAFGPDRRNRVISLVDSRMPSRQEKPPAEVEYLIVEPIEFEGLHESVLEGFELWLEVKREGKPFFLAYRRRPAGPG